MAKIMKHILILGAKGTLGQALSLVFYSAGFTVTAWDKDDVDITNTKELQEKVAECKPDCIINTVAINAVDAIETDTAVFANAKNINGLCVKTLAQIAETHDIPFVHYSTDYVFDGGTTLGYAEESEPNPISKYGETKYLGEKMAQEFSSKQYIIRLSRLFGIPGISAASKRSFVDTMIWLATESGKTQLEIVNNQISAPTYAPDLALFTKFILENNCDYGIYHGANEGECSWFDWAKEVFAQKNITIPIIPVSHSHFPRPAQVPAYSVLRNTKVPKQRHWKTALRDYLNA